MPMGVEDIKQFESLNEIRLNVFGYDGRDLFPLSMLKLFSTSTMDLLLLYKADYSNYVLITNMVEVVCQRNTKISIAIHLFRILFRLCEEGLAKLTKHMETCCCSPYGDLLLFDHQLREKIHISSETWLLHGLFH